jgi:hypothetical protein
MLINEILDKKLIEYNNLNREKRNYLGPSMLGDSCLRKIQLQYMQAVSEFSPQTLRTFAIGHALEPLVAGWLRIAGFYLRTHNNSDKQFGFTAADGKISGHVDGIIYDFPQELKEDGFKPPALWECKTMNNKNWNDVNKRGLLLSKPAYYAQVQLYMAYMDPGDNPCLFTALNKDTSELYCEFVPFDAETAQRYSDRAVEVIRAVDAGETLPGVSNDPAFYLCKICSLRNECFGGAK